MELIVYLVAAGVAAFVGARSGRRLSAIALGVCVAAVVVCALLSQLAIVSSGRPGWAAEGATAMPAQFGLLLLFAGLGFLGPSLIKNELWAMALSGVVVSLFVVPQIPLIYAGCVLFGMCV